MLLALSASSPRSLLSRSLLSLSLLSRSLLSRSLLSHRPVPGGIPCAAARVEGERPGGGRGERKEEGNYGGTVHGGVARHALGLAKRCQLK